MDAEPNVGADDPSRRSYDPTAVARVLVTTADKLVELLSSETALLRTSRTAEIGSLGAEKSRLSQILAGGWRQFQSAPGKIEALPATLRDELRDVALRLEDAARDNAAMLLIGRRATELVLAAVARALDSRRPKPTYTAARLSYSLPRDRAGLGLNRSA